MNALQAKLNRFWKRLSTPDWAWLPKINQDEQTRTSWARRSASYEGLPPTYRVLFAGREKEGREIPYTVLVPAFEGFLRRSPEKLICDQGEGVAVLEKSGEGCQAYVFHTRVSAALNGGKPCWRPAYRSAAAHRRGTMPLPACVSTRSPTTCFSRWWSSCAARRQK